MAESQGAPVCGGCAGQDVPVAEQLAAKRETVIAALRAAGIETKVQPCVDAHGAGRRRATVHARRSDDRVLRVGFAEARSHRIVDLADHSCPILVPALQNAAEPVRALARHLGATKAPIDAVLTVTEAGLDVDLRGVGKVPDKLRLGLGELAGRFDLARLSLHGDVVIELRPPMVRFGKAEVVLPPGGFLQATLLGEEALAGLVLEGVEGVKRVADLFSGSGTFALRLAEKAEVRAAEQDRPALAALDRAWRRTPGLKKIESEARDLFRRPMMAAELKNFDAVVFDPPRAGAEHQAHEIAKSVVKRVVAVSCNAQSFARDVRILIDSGFKLETVTPVDQFRHSSHVEIVGLLAR
ncbi:class I SAM-dependent RNA methyltransferase [Terrihabitans sp. B22-R8]|uniref:class I SAM-dependent RNA methyltransferase n=1 Tax=Terrihabitans sp. B22-R8 TaxID=3425128 RepID=UPI00403D40FE